MMFDEAPLVGMTASLHLLSVLNVLNNPNRISQQKTQVHSFSPFAKSWNCCPALPLKHSCLLRHSLDCAQANNSLRSVFENRRLLFFLLFFLYKSQFDQTAVGVSVNVVLCSHDEMTISQHRNALVVLERKDVRNSGLPCKY